jgi:uncharacterized protein YfbU (UPF0304 family)
MKLRFTKEVSKDELVEIMGIQCKVTTRTTVKEGIAVENEIVVVEDEIVEDECLEVLCFKVDIQHRWVTSRELLRYDQANSRLLVFDSNTNTWEDVSYRPFMVDKQSKYANDAEEIQNVVSSTKPISILVPLGVIQSIKS